MRVLVVDDSALFRRVLSDVLSSMQGIEVVGWAPNGKVALDKIRDLKPDLVTLDLEMPEMNGLAVIDALSGTKNAPAIIVVSALTKKGGQLTLEALQKGAFDFITKPEGASPEKSKEQLRMELTARLKAFSDRTGLKRPTPRQELETKTPKNIVAGRPGKPEMVLIGVSTGGPNALGVMLPGLPKNLGLPVLVVQHMPPVFTQTLAESLNTKCALKVCEAADGMVLEANTIYIAPGGRQMRIAVKSTGAKVIQITDDPPENNCRPAVDYLFRSAANHFPGKSLGVILTGMGSDGTIGLRLLKRHGCFVIAQDEPSCVVFGMPKSAIEAGVVDVVLPLGSIAQRIAVEIRMPVKTAPPAGPAPTGSGPRKI